MSLFKTIYDLFKRNIATSGNVKTGMVKIVSETEKVSKSITSCINAHFSNRYNAIINGENSLYLISMEAVMKDMDMKSIISECITKHGPRNIPANWNVDMIFAVITSMEDNHVIEVKALSIEGLIPNEAERQIIGTLKNDYIVKMVPLNS